MNKLILCFLLLSTLPLYAQESSELDLGDEGVESNPVVTESETIDVPEEIAGESSIEKSEVKTKEVSTLKKDMNMGTTSKEEFVPEIDESIVDHKEPEMSEAEKAEIAKAAEKAEPVEDEFVPAVKPELVKYTPATTVETEVETEKKFNPRKSHWLFTFGFENSKYEVIPEKRFEFEGRKDFKNDQKELWGGRLGFGGEIYLGAGFITRSIVEGYYMGTLFARVLNGGADAEDVEFAYTKETGQILGGDISQSLGWMFDLKTKNPFMDEMTYLTIEPFIEAGLGKAYAYNRTNYSYDTGTTPTSARESYRLRVRDDLLNARVGAGINMTSSAGFFLTLRATVNRYELTQRKIDGFTQPNGQTTTEFNETQKDAKIDPIVIYTLGGGYKF